MAVLKRQTEIISFQKTVVAVFFLSFLTLGLSIHKDYGVHWDEYQNQYFGTRWLNYIHKTISERHISSPKFIKYRKHDWVHGPAFEIFLSFIQKDILGITNPRKIIFARHLFTFLTFYLGVFFFYLLCKIHFRNWKTGLLGGLFLILSPRIFAHSFYNSVDIPFLSFYIIGIYALLKLLDKKTYLWVIFCALVSAVLIDIRIIGVSLSIYVFVFLLIELSKDKKGLIKTIKILLLYILFLIVFIVIFQPLLWENPLVKITEILKHAKEVSWSWPVLYLGKYIRGNSTPWHYPLVWIAISTPLIYIFYFLIGFLFSMKSLVKPSENPLEKRNNLVFTLWVFLPLIFSMGFKIGLYDGRRHLFFIYPAFLIFSLEGFIFLFRYLKERLRGLNYRITNVVLLTVTMYGLLNVVYFMICYHPYQNTYFNALAGRDMKEVKSKFELDYWGLSYKQALEYIVRTDHSPSIKIFVSNLPGKDNTNILKAPDRKRLIFVHNIKEAKYFASNYRWHPNPFELKHEYFSIKVRNAKIMVVYKLK